MQKLFENLVEELKNGVIITKVQKHEILARSLAKNACIKIGVKLEPQEMNALINELFACENPYISISGKPTLITTNIAEIDKQFN